MMKSVTRWEPRPWEGRVMSCCVQVVDMVLSGVLLRRETEVEVEVGIGLGWRKGRNEVGRMYQSTSANE